MYYTLETLREKALNNGEHIPKVVIEEMKSAMKSMKNGEVVKNNGITADMYHLIYRYIRISKIRSL